MVGYIPVFQEHLKVFIHFFGIGHRHRLAQGQGVVPGHLVLLTKLNQAPDGRIFPRIIVVKDRIVQCKRIGEAIGYQHLAVAVGDNAAGGLHRFRGSVAGDGLGAVLAAVDDLGGTEYRQIRQKHGTKQAEQYMQAGFQGIGRLHEVLLSSRGDQTGISIYRSSLMQPAVGEIDQRHACHGNQLLPHQQQRRKKGDARTVGEKQHLQQVTQDDGQNRDEEGAE